MLFAESLIPAEVSVCSIQRCTRLANSGGWLGQQQREMISGPRMIIIIRTAIKFDRKRVNPDVNPRKECL